MSNKMALDALTAIVASWEKHTFRREQYTPPDPKNGELVSVGYWSPSAAMVDAEAISNARAAIAALQAEPQPIEAIKAERRAIEYGDIIHRHVLVMRAAVVASHLESHESGMQWIKNTLFGPGHLPDVDEAIELGGAQALFDKEIAEHEAFRAAHPAPAHPAPLKD